MPSHIFLMTLSESLWSFHGIWVLAKSAHQSRENSDVLKGEIMIQTHCNDPCDTLLLFCMPELCYLECWFVKIQVIDPINRGRGVNLGTPILSKVPFKTWGFIHILRIPWTLKYYITVCEARISKEKATCGSRAASQEVEVFVSSPSNLTAVRPGQNSCSRVLKDRFCLHRGHNRL